MKTALILLLVALVSAALSWRRWHYLLGPNAFSPPTPPPRTSPMERRVSQARRQTLVQLQTPLPPGTRFQGRLSDAIDASRDQCAANLFVNWWAMRNAGYDPGQPVSVDVGGMTRADAIALLLAEASKGKSERWDVLDFRVVEDVITVSTRGDLARNTLTRVYDVRDLIRTSPGPFPIVGAAAGTAAAPPSARSPTDPARLGRLLGKIRAIESETWRDNGGHEGAVRELQGQLIITQTPWNQRVILYTLERERWRTRWTAFLVRAGPAVLLPVALAAGLRALPWWRRRRARLGGRCETCGYDLRATPSRCPECGKAVAGARPAPPVPGDMNPEPGNAAALRGDTVSNSRA